MFHFGFKVNAGLPVDAALDYVDVFSGAVTSAKCISVSASIIASPYEFGVHPASQEMYMPTCCSFSVGNETVKSFFMLL